MTQLPQKCIISEQKRKEKTDKKKQRKKKNKTYGLRFSLERNIQLFIHVCSKLQKKVKNA